MPVNPYDDRKVSLRRPYGNGDLDIVRASYTRRKANVTKALRSPYDFFWRQTGAKLYKVIVQSSCYLHDLPV